jgi:hypothetical protein
MPWIIFQQGLPIISVSGNPQRSFMAALQRVMTCVLSIRQTASETALNKASHSEEVFIGISSFYR